MPRGRDRFFTKLDELEKKALQGDPKAAAKQQISAFPMSARVVQAEGQKYNKKNYLLMHAMSANAGGQIGSIIAAAVMLSVLAGMGIV